MTATNMDKNSKAKMLSSAGPTSMNEDVVTPEKIRPVGQLAPHTFNRLSFIEGHLQSGKTSKYIESWANLLSDQQG